MIIFVFIKIFFHFEINAECVIPLDLSVEQDRVEFDITLNTGFYEVVDYSYEVQNGYLYITFYGSYYIDKIRETYVNHVTIFLDEQIKSVVFRSKDKSVTRWNVSE